MEHTPQHDRSQADEPRQPASAGRNAARGGGVVEGSFRGIVQEIISSVQQIIRSEVQLAKAEMRGDALAAGRGAGMLAASGVLAVLATTFLLLALVYALSKPLPRWLAALVVSGAVAAAAGVLTRSGIERIRSVNPAPEQTIDSFKEDVQWVRRQTR